MILLKNNITTTIPKYRLSNQIFLLYIYTDFILISSEKVINKRFHNILNFVFVCGREWI